MIFLRPWFLLLAFALPLFAFYIKKNGASYSAWGKIVDKELFAYLSTKSNNKKSSYMWWINLLGLFSLIIAISGPSWIEKPIPAYKQQTAAMIILDLSTDTTTQDLEKFKYEIQDIISEAKDTSIGLVVYADEPFLISPVVEDASIIKNLLPQINHSIMPANGNDINKATKYAEQKLKDAGFDSGELVFLSNNKKTNIKNVINKINSSVKNIKKTQKTSSQWVDCGYYFLFLPALICLFLFKKGLFMFLLLFSFQANANIFLNADQQGLKAFNNADYNTAQQKFKNKDWQASSLYKSGEYKKAIELFSDEYNKANAMAKSGDIEGAIKKYEKILEEKPTHEDAKFNLEYLKRQKQNQEEQSNQNNQENKEDNNKQEDKSKGQDNQKDNQNNQENQSQNQKEEQEKSQNNSQQNNNENKNSDVNKNKQDDNSSQGQQEQESQSTPASAEKTNEPNNAQTSQEASPTEDKNQEDKMSYAERAQSREQKFREIPEDAGGLLRAFINKEHQKRLRGM